MHITKKFKSSFLFGGEFLPLDIVILCWRKPSMEEWIYQFAPNLFPHRFKSKDKVSQRLHSCDINVSKVATG